MRVRWRDKAGVSFDGTNMTDRSDVWDGRQATSAVAGSLGHALLLYIALVIIIIPTSFTVSFFVCPQEFCNGYLRRGLTHGDEIWHDGRSG